MAFGEVQFLKIVDRSLPFARIKCGEPGASPTASASGLRIFLHVFR